MAKIARESDFIQATCVSYNKSGHSAATGSRSMINIYLCNQPMFCVTTSVIFVTRMKVSMEFLPAMFHRCLLAVFVSLYERSATRISEIFPLSPAIAPFEKCTFNLARNAVK
jgi:hypothetical protein